VEPFPDLSTLSDDELTAYLRGIEQEEDEISRRRRLLHGRIDILRGERTARLRAHVAAGDMELHTPESLERPLYAGTGELAAEDELAALPALDTLSEDDLRAMVLELEREEDDISLRRRFLHGQIDIIRAERAMRSRGGGEHVAAEGLGSILGHGRKPAGDA